MSRTGSLSNRLLKDLQRQENEKIKRAEDIYDDDEETMDYLERKSEGFINDRKSVFAGFGDDGINSAESIFDQQAIFKTGNK